MSACPICSKSIEPNTQFTCRACWWKLPAPDRMALGAMVRRNQPTATKLASVVAKYKEKSK